MKPEITLTPNDEEPRLYSKPSTYPVDEVTPQHKAIHLELEDWGRWNNERYSPATCASIEKLYLRGGRDTPPPATAPLPPNPRLVAIDQVWRLMVLRVPRHAAAIHCYYVMLEAPKLICRRLVIHPLAFPGFMGTARSMVVNIMRELDS